MNASAAPGDGAEPTPGRGGVGGSRLPLNATFPMVAIGGCLSIFCVMFCCYLCRLRRLRAEELGYRKRTYKTKKSYGSDLSDASRERCPVCLEDFQLGDEVAAACKCKHTFHVSCLTTWLKEQQNCPVCKTPVGCHKQRVSYPTARGGSGNDDAETQRNWGSHSSDDGRIWRLVSPLGHAVRAPLVPARLAEAT